MLVSELRQQLRVADVERGGLQRPNRSRESLRRPAAQPSTVPGGSRLMSGQREWKHRASYRLAVGGDCFSVTNRTSLEQSGTPCSGRPRRCSAGNSCLAVGRGPDSARVGMCRAQPGGDQRLGGRRSIRAPERGRRGAGVGVGGSKVTSERRGNV